MSEKPSPFWNVEVDFEKLVGFFAIAFFIGYFVSVMAQVLLTRMKDQKQAKALSMSFGCGGAVLYIVLRIFSQ